MSHKKGREEFRNHFYERLAEGGKGAITDLANRTGISRNTLYSWGRAEEGLPDIHEISLLAEAKGVSPAWLALDMGPRSKESAEAGFGLGRLLESLPGLQDVIDSYGSATETDRALILGILSKFRQPGGGEKLVPPAKTGTTNLFRSADIERKELPRMHELPMVDRIAADHMPTFAETRETQLVDIRYAKKNHYCLMVKGRSMHPTISEGDRVVVENLQMGLEAFDVINGPADKRDWLKLHEEVVCAIVDQGDPVLKRIFVFDGGKETGFRIYLQSDNRKVKPIVIEKETSLKIVGIVRAIMRDPKNYE